MSRSCPLAKFAVFSVQYSARICSGSSKRPRPLVSPVVTGSCSTQRWPAAFTLIELLVVVAIIAVLAGLTLSTLGYVNKKGAESRAQAEVAALSAAIESFKLGEGFYPTNAASLYTNLCPAVDGRKVYFEPAPSMVVTNGSVLQFADPWATLYGYSNYTSYFELWSTAGGANSNNWIRN